MKGNKFNISSWEVFSRFNDARISAINAIAAYNRYYNYAKPLPREFGRVRQAMYNQNSGYMDMMKASGVKDDFVPNSALAANCHSKCVTTFVDHFTPTNAKWFTLEMTEHLEDINNENNSEELLMGDYKTTKKNNDDEKINSAQALENISKIIRNEIDDSNFNSEMLKCYDDLVVGTCIMEVRKGMVKGKNPVVYEHIPMYQVIMEDSIENGDSNPNIFRLYNVNRNFILSKYPDITDSELRTYNNLCDSFSDEMQNSDEHFKNSHKINILEFNVKFLEDNAIFYKRLVYVVIDGEITTSDGKKDKKEGKILKGNLFYERIYEEPPYIVAYWNKLPDIPYGLGIGLISIPDIQTHDAVMDLILSSGQVRMKPMVLVPKGFSVNLNSDPEGMLQVLEVKGPDNTMPVGAIKDAVATFDMKTQDSLFSLVRTLNLPESIRETYNVNPIGSMNDSVRTAEEVGARREMSSQASEAAFSALKKTLLLPIVTRTLRILVEKKVIKLDKSVVSKLIDRNAIHIKTPLEESYNQRESEKIFNTASRIGQTVGVDTFLKSINTGEYVTTVAKNSGYENIFKSSKEINEIQENLQKEQQRMSAAQSSNLEADTQSKNNAQNTNSQL